MIRGREETPNFRLVAGRKPLAAARDSAEDDAYTGLLEKHGAYHLATPYGMYGVARELMRKREESP
jgi:hypothetical protein